ncbi:hypothetical protein SAY87_014113 [Trapa incisa]|uniref:Uncharacterized protein n=1 Tax=Trapa incisa TaxID=236973 RepID=A0AAN7GVM0_9MYRT|nr:hypothetical protein SAY87_014113 [Trapa incisa]
MESSNGRCTAAESTVFHGDRAAPTFRASDLPLTCCLDPCTAQDVPRWPCLVKKKMTLVEYSFEQDECTTSSSGLHGNGGRCTSFPSYDMKDKRIHDRVA